jgi:acetyl-CoA carboxylase alpha subunit
MLLKEALERNLAELRGMPVEQMLDGRYEKYRKMGAWAGD